MCGFLYAASALYAANRYPDPLWVLFCWVSAGFWTALMGFLQRLLVAINTVYLRRLLAMNH